VNKTNKEFAKVHTSNRNTLSMRAEWEPAYLWLPVNLVQCCLNESVFHLMLQNNVAPNIDKIVKQSVAYNFGCRALYNLPLVSKC